MSFFVLSARRKMSPERLEEASQMCCSLSVVSLPLVLSNAMRLSSCNFNLVPTKRSIAKFEAVVPISTRQNGIREQNTGAKSAIDVESENAGCCDLATWADGKRNRAALSKELAGGCWIGERQRALNFDEALEAKIRFAAIRVSSGLRL